MQILKPNSFLFFIIIICSTTIVKSQTNLVDYYTNVISETKKNTVKLNNRLSNSTDMTADLQKLIDEVSKYQKGDKKGGTILIKKKKKGASIYRLRNIQLKSNVRLKIDKEVIIKPFNPSKPGYCVLKVGESIKGIENVEIVCADKNKKFTIDISETRGNREPGSYNVRAVGVVCVDNFLISDFHIIDNQSKISAILFNGYFTDKNTKLHGIPKNGILQNVSSENMHRGYSLCQVQMVKNVLFRNMHAKDAPAALNFESGAGIANIPTYEQTELGIVDDIRVENISCTNCVRVVGFSPHVRINGSVYVDGVTANQCMTAVEVSPGFIDAAVSSKIKNIQAKPTANDPKAFKRGSYKNIVVRNVVFNYKKFTLYPEAVARRTVAPVSLETVERADAHLTYDELMAKYAKEGEELYNKEYSRITAIPVDQRSEKDKKILEVLSLDDLQTTGHYTIDVSEDDVTINNIDQLRIDQGGTENSKVRKIVYEDEPSVCEDIREGFVMVHRKGKRFQAGNKKKH
ncbi:hypothetical protein Q4Q39_00355 [Flavivirga amylovorans]|uniref:Right-handed parallel beta-helix repeat-containing protein n=1 Tax=Flavivirga amylovorans TaxID=870486 RepID=A0ABT8WVY5_9FLAO|nr:hypothetical protein [Flavivirga amylovorans]MDO5985841.1 hypothetical protein [Flavivirga amylovorans]